MFKMFILIGVLSVACTQQDSSKDVTPVNTSKELPQEIPISEEFKTCKQDSDCKVIHKLCLCCKFDAINKDYSQKYLDQEKDCKSPPPPCGCVEPKAIPKCVNNKCEMT